MVDRLQRAIQILESLLLTIQESVAEQLEHITAAYAPSNVKRRSHAGIWADLPDDMADGNYSRVPDLQVHFIERSWLKA